MEPKSIFEIPAFDPHSIPPVVMEQMTAKDFYEEVTKWIVWDVTDEGDAYSVDASPVFVKNNSFCTSETGFNTGFYIFSNAPEKMYLFLKLGGTNDLRMLVDIASNDFLTDLICRDEHGEWVRSTWDQSKPLSIDRFTLTSELKRLALHAKLGRFIRRTIEHWA